MVMRMKAGLNGVSITGMSYILKDACGVVGHRMRLPCAGAKDACRILEAQGYSKGQPKNVGRFDQISLMTYAATLWACVDAGLPFAQGKRRVGIVGSNDEGALDSSQAFFVDYVKAGRSSARSNLFVYTLSTTPLAEAALFCGFTGPVWYMHQSSGGMGRLIEEAALCVLQEDVSAMLAVRAGSEEAVCCVVQKDSAKSLFSVSKVQDHLHGTTSVGRVLQVSGVSFKDEGVL